MFWFPYSCDSALPSSAIEVAWTVGVAAFLWHFLADLILAQFDEEDKKDLPKVFCWVNEISYHAFPLALLCWLGFFIYGFFCCQYVNDIGHLQVVGFRWTLLFASFYFTVYFSKGKVTLCLWDFFIYCFFCAPSFEYVGSAEVELIHWILFVATFSFVIYLIKCEYITHWHKQACNSYEGVCDEYEGLCDIWFHYQNRMHKKHVEQKIARRIRLAAKISQ